MKQIAKLLNVEKFKDYNEMIDSLEAKIVSDLPSIEIPYAHTFTPGLYSREMVVPAGALLTSKIHLTRHQFIVSKGSMLIFDEEQGWVKITAPYHGVTEAGTRRIGLALEESIWTTFHACEMIIDKDYTADEMVSIIEEIEDTIIKKRINNKLN